MPQNGRGSAEKHNIGNRSPRKPCGVAYGFPSPAMHQKSGIHCLVVLATGAEIELASDPVKRLRKAAESGRLARPFATDDGEVYLHPAHVAAVRLRPSPVEEQAELEPEA